MVLVNSTDIRANIVRETNIQDIQEVRIQLTNILNSKQNINKKIRLIEHLTGSSQNISNCSQSTKFS